MQTTDWFTRAGGSGLAANNAVKEAAFSAELLKDNENSKPLALGEGRVAVIRKAEYEAPRQRALDEVRTEVETALLAEQAQARAQADADAVLAAAQGGKPLAEAAAEKGAEVLSPGLVKRDNAGLDPALLSALFKMPRPAAGGASYAKAKLASGTVAVLGLSAVQDPPGEASPELARGQLRDLYAGAEFNSYRKAIEEEIAVKRISAPQPEAAAAAEDAPAEDAPQP